jgi:hypothetical protein
VNFAVNNKRQSETSSGKTAETSVPAFSFGPRRYASKGPRRLFLPQKCLVSPVFEPDVERPHAILHSRLK